MTRVAREYRRLCVSEGFNLLGIDVDRKHCRLRFELGDVFAAATPSDHRNLVNVRAAIRRLHRIGAVA